MIFQDPLSSLHPFYKIGDQLVEAVQAHRDVSKAQALDRAVEMLGLVGIPEPRRRVDVLPARVLRRHAPARDDRDGAHQRPQAADRRRADDRARRHRAGADPRPHPAPAARARHRDRDDHPRPRRGGRGGRRHRRDVRRADRRVRRQGHDLRRCPSTPTPGGCCKSIPRLDSPRGEELVPIPGRPPSLINKPPGCSFHPRCPYVREAHKRIDPQLAPAADAGDGAHKHEVACLLPGQTRRALWAALRAGAHARRGAGARRRARRGRRPRGGRRGPGAGRHRGRRGVDGRPRPRTPTEERRREHQRRRQAHRGPRPRDALPAAPGDHLPEAGRRRAAVDGISLRRLRGRDARARGRVGLRQVDDRAPAHAAARADRAARSSTRATTSRTRRAASSSRCGATCR